MTLNYASDNISIQQMSARVTHYTLRPRLGGTAHVSISECASLQNINSLRAHYAQNSAYIEANLKNWFTICHKKATGENKKLVYCCDIRPCIIYDICDIFRCLSHSFVTNCKYYLERHSLLLDDDNGSLNWKPINSYYFHCSSGLQLS